MKDWLVFIKHIHAPYMKKFRWDGKWWVKTRPFHGTYEGHEFEIPKRMIVSVRLKDLNEYEKRHLIDLRK